RGDRQGTRGVPRRAETRPGERRRPRRTAGARSGAGAVTARPRRGSSADPRVRALPPARVTAVTHPAMIVALLSVAAVLMICVTYILFEPDFWQHLLVGKAIWAMRTVPDQQLWSWPDFGARHITPSWLFRAIIWPIWSAGGLWGLYLWRGITTLVVFVLLWATARRMGARGFAALATFALCGLVYKARSQVR